MRIFGLFLIFLGAVIVLSLLGVLEMSVGRFFAWVFTIVFAYTGLSALFRKGFPRGLVSLVLSVILVTVGLGYYSLGFWETIAIIIGTGFIELGLFALGFGRRPWVRWIAGGPFFGGGTRKTIEESLDDIKRLNVTVEGENVILRVKSCPDKLYRVVYTGNPHVYFDRQEDTGNLVMRLEGIPFISKNEVDLSLNESVEISFDVSMDVSSIKMDLEKLKISSLFLEGDVTDLKIRLPRYNSTVVIGSDVSNIELEIPNDVGVRAVVSDSVGWKEMKGFENREGVYYTKNWDTANFKVDLKIESDVSRIKIKIK